MTTKIIRVPGRFEKALGYANHIPLPALPSGLVRFNLFGVSLGYSAVNRASGDAIPDPVLVSDITGIGTLSYEDTYGHSNNRTAGWGDPTLALNYTDGYSVLAVSSVASGSTSAAFTTQDFSSTDGTGERLNRGPSLASFRAQRRDASVSILPAATVTFGSSTTGPVAAFGVLDVPDDEVRCLAPHHSGTSTAQSLSDAVGWEPSGSPGAGWARAYVSAGSAENDVVEDVRMYCAGVWDRPLSDGEMMTAYAAIKPWLARMGVDIA